KFTKRNDFSWVCIEQLIIYRDYICRITIIVDITRDNVYISITGIPVVILRLTRPDPYQVVQSFLLKYVEHQYPQFSVGLCILGSPPKPFPCSFMYRTPYHGNILVL